MIPRASLTGLILTGGQSRRMRAGESANTPTSGGARMPGGQSGSGSQEIDKGLLALHGKQLVAHAKDFLAPHVQSVLISANRNLDDYGRYGQVLADDGALGAYLGPLAGVAQALARAATPWVVVIPVDVINLPTDLVARLCVAAERNAVPLAYASTEDSCQLNPGAANLAQFGYAGRVQPLCMIAHASLAAELRAYLEAGGRKVQLWQQLSGAVPVYFDGGDDVFSNINTPEDLQRAEQSARSDR